MIYKVLKRVPRKNKRYLSNIDEKKKLLFFLTDVIITFIPYIVSQKYFRNFRKVLFYSLKVLRNWKKKGEKTWNEEKIWRRKNFVAKLWLLLFNLHSYKMNTRR